MNGDTLSDLLDETHPLCPRDGVQLEDDSDDDRPRFRCPICGLVAIG